MNVIPVIDIRHGLAVRAVAGDRANYRPLNTPLAQSSDPADVARGYMGLFPFSDMYIADLDGIEGRGADFAALTRIADAIGEGAELWADIGAHDVASIEPLVGIARMRAVLGSESLHSIEELAALRAALDDRVIVSLDFRGDEFVGPPLLLRDADLWPRRVVVMTLARVGAGLGPDIDRIRSITRRGRGREVYAAGGTRNREDLLAIRAADASGALVASALHGGQMKTGDLKDIAGW